MINVFSPDITEDDISSVLKTLNEKSISGTSEVVNEFENKFKNLIGRNYCTSVSNGSVALDLALQSLDLKKGDEIILPSFTIISCLSSILRTEATPIFCDVDLDSWNMTLEDVKKRITKKTKAVIMVHTYGLTAEADEIEKLCKKNGIFLIEDASEAHGQKYKDKYCGNFGTISTFSFYANKHITTGEGGALLTNSLKYEKIFKRMRNLDFQSNKRFVHNEAYWNQRLGGLQAALGISQIKNLKKTIKLKTLQGEIYNELLEDFKDQIKIPLKENLGVKNHYWVYGIVIKKNISQKKIMEGLKKEGIETRPFFWALHEQPVYLKNFTRKFENKNSEYIARKGLYLPLGIHLDSKKQEFIVNKLLKII